MRRAAILTIAVILFAASAHAQGSQDYATARALYNEGLDLEDKGDLAGALARYRGAWASLKTSRTGYAYARSLARANRLVDALDVAYAVDRIAESPDDSKDAKDDRAAAQKLAGELKSRIPSLRVVVQSAPPGARVEVRVDDAVVPAETVGLARKVDPGAHRVSVSTNGGTPVEITVTLSEREERVATIDAPPAPAVVTPQPPPPPDHSAEGSTWSTQKTFAIVAGGAGIATLVTGLALGQYARSTYDDASTHCLGSICDADGVSATHNARDLALASTVVTIAGAGLVVAGVVLWLTAPSKVSTAFAGGVRF